jgi:hypothetical protein
VSTTHHGIDVAADGSVGQARRRRGRSALPAALTLREKRHSLREEINPVEAAAIRDAATRVLEHGESVASIARDWTARGIRPVAAKQWWPTSIVGTLTSPRLAGLRERQGRTYPVAGWSAIIDVDAP